jgi:hypothetical protein
VKFWSNRPGQQAKPFTSPGVLEMAARLALSIQQPVPVVALMFVYAMFMPAWAKFKMMGALPAIPVQ